MQQQRTAAGVHAAHQRAKEIARASSPMAPRYPQSLMLAWVGQPPAGTAQNQQQQQQQQSDPNRVWEVQLSNSDAPTVDSGGGTTAADISHQGQGQGGRPGPLSRLPAFRVWVVSADRAKLQLEELRELRLYYARQVRAGCSSWCHLC